LDRTVSLEEYGFVVASDALGQMIFSPLFGIMADRLDSIRLVSFICCLTFCSGNLFYATISLVPRTWGDIEKARMWAMIVSRFVVGIGTGINAAARSYVSKATYESERTTHISLLSLFQTLGFILGPVIQASLTSLGEKGFFYVSPDSTFFIDMYTATG
jgi:ceroid-lipofuscinosis MFS transporter 7